MPPRLVGLSASVVLGHASVPGFQTLRLLSYIYAFEQPTSELSQVLGEVHRKDACQVCRDFRPQTKKD